jgi:lysophospholipase L1-like esterase
MRLHRFFINGALLLTALILSLICGEIALRAYDAARKVRTEPPQPAPVPLHILKQSPVLYGLNPEHSEISSQGVRDDEVVVPKPPGIFRILMLGDSVAYGSSLPAAETFPNRFERMLRDQFGPVEVVNAAVAGYTTYNELHYYLEDGRKFGADLVIVAFCMNDVANPRLHWGDAPGVIFPPEAIPNHDYDRDHILPRVRKLEKEKASPQDRSDVRSLLVQNSRLFRLAEKAVAPVYRRRLRNFADTGARIPTFITGEDTLSIEVLLDRNSPEWRWLAFIYHRLHDAVRAERAQLVIVIFPLAYQLDDGYPFFPQESLAQYCRENSIPCLDLLPAFRKHSKQDVFVLDKEGRDDIWHLTDYGHKLSAHLIQGFLQEQSLVRLNP